MLTFFHPRFPFGRIWLPIPSLLIYLAAWALLCSGSYVLVDVRIPNDRVRVRIRLI